MQRLLIFQRQKRVTRSRFMNKRICSKTAQLLLHSLELVIFKVYYNDQYRLHSTVQTINIVVERVDSPIVYCLWFKMNQYKPKNDNSTVQYYTPPYQRDCYTHGYIVKKRRWKNSGGVYILCKKIVLYPYHPNSIQCTIHALFLG